MKEQCPKLSATDLVDIIRIQSDKVIVVDIRNPTQSVVLLNISI